MYIVQEIQTSQNGTVALLPAIQRESKNEAESAYYSILAAAAVSTLPCHAAVIYTNNGNIIKHDAYVRGDQPIGAAE